MIIRVNVSSTSDLKHLFSSIDTLVVTYITQACERGL